MSASHQAQLASRHVCKPSRETTAYMTTYEQNTATTESIQCFQQEAGCIIDVDLRKDGSKISDTVISRPEGGEPKEWPGGYFSNEEALTILKRKNSGLKPDLSRYGYRFVKRAFDLMLSSVAIIIGIIPALILCAVICIKSPGAGPLYSQKRIGRLKKDGSFKVFRMWKLRSMVPNADQMLEQLQESNEADGPLFKIKDDPRVIPGIGAFIRKHSIDEFGQIVNVWLGNIPLRIIKTGQGEPCEISVLFALPAKEIRTEEALFPQVNVAFGTCLRTVPNFFKNLITQLARTQCIFAKRNFGHLANSLSGSVIA